MSRSGVISAASAHHPRRAAAHRQDRNRPRAIPDRRYLLRTSDPKLSAVDIALGYKQLPEVERGWKDTSR